MKADAVLVAAEYRRAIKCFDKNRIIPDEKFRNLLNVVKLSPSAFGLEPWRILVVKNSDLKAQLKPYVPGGQLQLDTCSHFVIFTVITSLTPSSDYIRHINLDVKGMDENSHKQFIKRFELFQSEKLGISNERNRIDWAGKQAYLALGNMLLAAALYGIDSCPIEGFYPYDIDKFLLKNNYIDNMEHVAVMAAFGYRAEPPISNKKRREENEFIKTI